MNPQDLLNNPQLQNISPEKLQLLMILAQNTSPSGANPKDMAASLKSASDRASKEGMEFSSGERDLIVEVLKQSLPPQEQKKVDMMMQLMKTMRK